MIAHNWNFKYSMPQSLAATVASFYDWWHRLVMRPDRSASASQHFERQLWSPSDMFLDSLLVMLYINLRSSEQEYPQKA